MKIGRDNYVSFDDNYDKWILNPGWEIILSISFVKNICLLIITCIDHNCGTNNLIFNP